MNATLLSPLLALMLVVPQEEDPSGGSSTNPFTPNHPAYAEYESAVNAADLGVDVFTPEYCQPNELTIIAGQLTNTLIAVRNMGGANDNIEYRQRLTTLGDSIAVIDGASGRTRMLEILHELDLKLGAERRERQERESAHQPSVVTYTPRHISLNTAHGAVTGMLPGTLGVEATPLYEVGTLLLRGSEAKVADALDLVRSIDQPRPQVLMTIYAIAPIDGPSSTGLPSELVDGLVQLVPRAGFDLLGSASVRATVGATTVKLESTLRDGEELGFSASPSAFDESTGDLFLGDCTLNVRGNSRSGATPRRDVRVTTSVAVELGEYVVLAAAGGDRTYFVVHTQEG